MDISIIICTYNRAALLKRCLKSIAALDAYDPVNNKQTNQPGLKYEVLVVDNASTDNTKDVIEQAHGIENLKYLFEAKQGKSNALNLALKESKGELLVFADDDIQLDSQALSEFWSSYQAHGDQCDWFGGCVKLDWHTTKAPAWLNDDIQTVLDGALGIHDLGEQCRPYTSQDKYPIGAAMAVTRKLVNRVGEFRTDLGPNGGARGASDDTDYLIRAQAEDLVGYYVATAKAFHYVDPARLTLKGFYTYGYAKGMNGRRADPTKVGALSWQRVLNQTSRCVIQIVKGRTGNVRVCLLNIGFEFGKRKANKKI